MTKISTEILESIQGTQLFYPCSGDDIYEPIELFAPYIQDFWFADVAYFNRMKGVTQGVRPALTRLLEFLFLDRQVNIVPVPDWEADRVHSDTPAFVVSEWYEHLPSGREIAVHRCRRRGPSAMRSHITNLGVFFYRGTSQEGSTTNWLYASRKHIQNKRHQMTWELLQNLKDGGLMVVDGSDGGVGCWILDDSPYRPLQRFTDDRQIGVKAAEIATPFTDGLGHAFQCVGYAGERYGPTLAWQVKKSLPPDDCKTSGPLS